MLSEIHGCYRLLEATNKDPKSIAFFSEGDIYFQYFEGYLRYLRDHSDLTVYYITSDKKDRAFNHESDRFHVFYLDQLAPKAIENLKTKAIVMTVRDLHNYHLKRSRFCSNHIYLCHGMSSMHLQYQKGNLDHYDTIFCVGPHQVAELRAAEEIYKLRKKNLVECGYWWLEHLYLEGRHAEPNGSILIAPSWHPGNLFDNGIVEEALPSLHALGKPVILRPHPEFAKRFPDKLDALSQKITSFQNISLERDLGSTRSWLDADLLVTDWSNICYEFALGLERPVLFVDLEPRIDNPDWREIPCEPIEFAVRDGLIGEAIPPSALSTIGTSITSLLSRRTAFRSQLDGVRQHYLFNWLSSDEVGGKYLISLFHGELAPSNSIKGKAVGDR